MRAAPTVSVVIPHYRDLRGLELCLNALAEQTLPKDDFEIIVADNASPEGAAAVTEVIKDRARLVTVSEKGAGPARNGGVAVSEGQILAFVDSDCVPHPDWLKQGLRALAKYDFIGGRVVVLVDDLNAMTDAEAFERVFAFDFKTYITRKGFTGAGNLFCSRAVFDHVGTFRAGVSEDLEWSHRARAKGYSLGYAPEAIVGHPARRTWQELRAKWLRVNAETYALYLERPAGRLKWFVRSLALPASAIAHSPKVFTSDQLGTTRQRMQAFSMLFRLRSWRLAHAIALLIGREK